MVTGAGRGLGRLIAAALVARGHRVLVTDVNEAAARDLILAQAGRLDVWVNNAGVLVTGPAWEQAPDVRRLMIEVNALGTVNGTVAAIEAMRGTGGHIVNIVSLAGLTPVPGEAVYAASKHAAIGFSLSTLADLRLAGIEDIDISCVCPDGIWTPMLHDKLDDPASALSFSGKLLTPEGVVDAVRKVLDRPRPVTAIPRWRGLQVRLADALPLIGLRALPLAVAQGRRVQRKMLAKNRSA
ncbi:SDR family oxidoreductase [Streptacidiphilus pinicola]|uniref:SDR family oxidoreductase n=1 Tax=Streptacidiphilus pinicola TaxID=2219663 RepID=UPI001FB47D9E|nr:SDR family NAD(P)-dependent oxidoreductase [Streptacidiphilus pinicola]